jgi:hypothetical protein
MMLEGEEISQFSFLDKQSKSISQSQPNATLGENEASCVLTDSILHLQSENPSDGEDTGHDKSMK